jgi:LPS export ABC transporter protein LptC
MKLKRSLVLSVLAIILGVLFVGVQALRSKSTSILQEELLATLQAEYDYYISGMVLDRFLPDNFHNYRLTADRVTHFPVGSISVMDNPALHWFDVDTNPWHITARNGVFYPDDSETGDRLQLREQVVASSATENGMPLRITSDSLQVMPDQQEISTEDSVTLVSGNAHLTGIGLHAWLPGNRISLQKGSGIYE